MAQNKKSLYPESMVQLAEFAHGLGHPARICIVTQLMGHPEGKSCSELVGCSPLAQSTMSQHLKVLVSIGLLEGKPRDKSVIYTLKTERLQSFCHAFQQTLGTGQCQEGQQD